MSELNKNSSTKIKWIIISVVVPVFVALIAIVPQLLSKDKDNQPASLVPREIKQYNKNGHNISNVARDVIIAPFDQKVGKEK